MSAVQDAMIADLQRQLDDCRNERDAALAREAALAEVLEVINRSPDDPQPVFEAILEKARLLCGAEMGVLQDWDGEYIRMLARYGYSEDLQALMTPLRQRTRPGLGQLPVFLGERFVHVLDATKVEIRTDEDEGTRNFIERSGTRTWLSVPLRRNDTLIGAIAVARGVVRAFTITEIVMLEGLAAQAVIAMENARLLTELRQRTGDLREALEQQTATAEVLQVINSSPGDLAPVFDAILEKAHTLCGAVMGSLVLFDGRHFRAAATLGYPEGYDAVVRQAQLPTIRTQALIDGERFVHVLDLKTSEVELDHAVARNRVAMTARTALWMPLRKDNAFLGFISAYRSKVQAFSDKEITLLENFAAQAVIAMDNARLLDEIRQRQEELRITFENMADGVAMFDATPRLVAWNLKFQDIMDLPGDVLAARPTFPDYIRYLAERGEYGSETDPEEEVRNRVAEASRNRANERVRPDGRVIEIRQVPIAGGGFVMVLTDITERKRNEDQIRAARDAAEEASRTIEIAYRDLKAAQANLIQVEKMASLGQLTAGIAHEIKNPLNFVNNFSDLSIDLLNELQDAITLRQQREIDELSATLKGNLQKINEHGRRADGIVRSMLEHSRGSSGDRRSVDLNTLVEEALNLAYHGARARDQSFTITLERDLDRGIEPVEVVPQDITRVLLNLFNNGFYAVHRRQQTVANPGFEPTLKVITRQMDSAVEIHVWDNGTGIPDDIRDKLFQPFFTTKPTGEGTGLGLSISYDIVTQQHGGSITVDSQLGEYSEFTMRLPRAT